MRFFICQEVFYFFFLKIIKFFIAFDTITDVFVINVFKIYITVFTNALTINRVIICIITLEFSNVPSIIFNQPLFFYLYFIYLLYFKVFVIPCVFSFVRRFFYISLCSFLIRFKRYSKTFLFASKDSPIVHSFRTFSLSSIRIRTPPSLFGVNSFLSVP